MRRCCFGTSNHRTGNGIPLRSSTTCIAFSVISQISTTPIPGFRRQCWKSSISGLRGGWMAFASMPFRFYLRQKEPVAKGCRKPMRSSSACGSAWMPMAAMCCCSVRRFNLWRRRRLISRTMSFRGPSILCSQPICLRPSPAVRLKSWASVCLKQSRPLRVPGGRCRYATMMSFGLVMDTSLTMR